MLPKVLTHALNCSIHYKQSRTHLHLKPTFEWTWLTIGNTEYLIQLIIFVNFLIEHHSTCHISKNLWRRIVNTKWAYGYLSSRFMGMYYCFLYIMRCVLVLWRGWIYFVWEGAYSRGESGFLIFFGTSQIILRYILIFFITYNTNRFSNIYILFL